MNKLFKLLRLSLFVMLFLFVGIGQALAGSRDFLQTQKIAQQKAAALGASISQPNFQQDRAEGLNLVTSHQTTLYSISCGDKSIVRGDAKPSSVTEDTLSSEDNRYEEVEIDGIKANVDKLEECATIVANNYSGNVVVPESITCDGKVYPVTTIGEYCFSNSNVTNVSLPKSIKSLKKGCFSGCEQLDSITIPKSVVELGIEAAYSLETFNDSVIYDGCFCGCTNLKKVIFEEGSQLKIIGGYCFWYCSSLKKVELPSSVKDLGISCFHWCTRLENITIPEGVSKIPNSCFEICSSLKGVDLPSSVKELGEACFDGCSSLENITIPEGVSTIPVGCLSNCDSLKSIDLPSSVKELGDYCFSGSGLENITIPEGVSTIPMGCFEYCDSLKSIDLPSSVKELGDECFCCSGLKNITIPEGISKIPNSCFLFCNSLKSIDLPSSVEEMDISCFYGCVLDCIYLRAKSVPTNLKNSFYYGVNPDKTVLYVPEESLDNYKNKCGDLFKEILPLETTGIADVLLDGLSISANGGKLELTGLQEGTKVRLFSFDGKCIGETEASNGKVSFSTTEPMVIAKIGSKSVKIVTSKNL